MTDIEFILVVIALGGWCLVLFSYAGYPVVLAVWASVHQLGNDLRFVFRKTDRRQQEPTESPRVAVVIAAYNEERHIAARIQNLLDQDYPPDKLRLYIASDGSKDRTPEILRSFQDERLLPKVFEINRGKASVLNDLRHLVSEPIVVFSDANTFFERQAIRKLVRWFQDPTIGGVTGELRLLGNDGQNQDSLYWRMEQALKFFEGRIGALLGANGAIYAVRRELWPSLAPNAICDDFVIGMHVSATGYRLAYDPTAWAEEDTPHDISEELHRRLRIGVGNFQSLFEHPEFLTRTNWPTKFSYLSHKVLRWVAPHLLLLSLLASAMLAVSSAEHADAWRAWVGIQALAYLVASLCYRRSCAGLPLPKPARLPTFFFALNWAFLLASVRYARGSHQGTWRRTKR
jgi:cellulose synthase/poly-beta-1,6-N-acetylglucosamine synthase-like glycosyltransferase